MAYLAIRGSGAVNGVSRLHGQVSRQLFAPLFPRWPEDEVPDRPRDQRRARADLGLGAGRRSLDGGLWKGPLAGDDWTRWSRTSAASPTPRSGSSAPPPAQSLVEYARERLSRQLTASGASPEAVDEAKHLFDPDALTLGFARRFATYKRPNLLLHDPERLLRLLTNPQRPVQLIIAGKAHPGGPGGPGADPGMDAVHPAARGRARM